MSWEDKESILSQRAWNKQDKVGNIFARQREDTAIETVRNSTLRRSADGRLMTAHCQKSPVDSGLLIHGSLSSAVFTATLG